MTVVGCIRHSLKHTCHQYGSMKDSIMLIIMIMTMVITSIIVGPIHNTMYHARQEHASGLTDGDILSDGSYAILQSVTLVFAYSVVIFIHQLVTSIYGHLHISLQVTVILHVLIFYLFIQTQHNLFRRIHNLNGTSLRLWRDL